ncbi:MAG: hypothetical protein ACPGWR_05495 [Ardenticatenaceae bacterium]
MKENLFIASDPQGRIVALTEECYTFHILVEHPDLSDENEIAQTIKRPDYITRDAIDDERLIYYRTYRRRPQRFLIKVVVEENEVVTAYRVKRLKQGETIIWRK